MNNKLSLLATAIRQSLPYCVSSPATTSVKTAAEPAKVMAAPVKDATPSAKAAPKPFVSAPSNFSTVFSNVSLVNKVVGVAGSIDQARQVAEAVTACGGVEEFLKRLELVAGIRSA